MMILIETLGIHAHACGDMRDIVYPHAEQCWACGEFIAIEDMGFCRECI